MHWWNQPLGPPLHLSVTHPCTAVLHCIGPCRATLRCAVGVAHGNLRNLTAPLPRTPSLPCAQEAVNFVRDRIEAYEQQGVAVSLGTISEEIFDQCLW